MPNVGDLIPHSSGTSHLGVDGFGEPIVQTFDITSIAPFGHIHQNSGIYHDPFYGQSGVLRFSLAALAFQVSVDGGLSFNDVQAGNTVDTIGIINGANLTGDVDLATASSGFLAITDNTGASPISFAVDNLGLSGLWNFPSQGFNGRVVNALTDFHGTEAQGVISVVGASGVLVDIIGQTMTISAAAEQIRCYTETFGLSSTWNVVHNLGSVNVVFAAYNSSDDIIIPDRANIADANTVDISFNIPVAGKAVVIACI